MLPPVQDFAVFVLSLQVFHLKNKTKEKKNHLKFIIIHSYFNPERAFVQEHFKFFIGSTHTDQIINKIVFKLTNHWFVCFFMNQPINQSRNLLHEISSAHVRYLIISNSHGIDEKEVKVLKRQPKNFAKTDNPSDKRSDIY